MAKRILPKPLTSISAKLLTVIVLTGIGINLAIIFSIGAFQHHVAAPYHAHLARYVAYLVDDLGSPPERARAMQLAAQTDMIITFESGSRKWSTAPDVHPFPLDQARTRFDRGGVEVVTYRGSFAVFVNRGQGRIGFYMPRQERAEKKVKLLVLFLLVFISTLLIVAFVAIRWVLRPLGWLKRGVDEVGRGNLGYRVPEKRCDELRDLSEAFNAMTERLSRLIKSKDQLLLDVSHELRTPITRIRVALAMLPDSDGKDSIVEDLAEIEAKITELLETARTLGVKAELNRRPVDLAALLQQVAEVYQNQPPGVVLDIIETGAPLMLDENMMLKALRNVVDNAVKYSRPDSAPVRASLSRHQGAAVIRVQDFGIGIAAEDLPFVFEPFYRADKARSPRGGFGLGLSLVKTIISAHNGRVDIESQPGSGTTVTIHLGDVAD